MFAGCIKTGLETRTDPSPAEGTISEQGVLFHWALFQTNKSQKKTKPIQQLKISSVRRRRRRRREEKKQKKERKGFKVRYRSRLLLSDRYRSISWSTSRRDLAKLGRLDSALPLLFLECPPESVRDSNLVSGKRHTKKLAFSFQNKN